MTDRERWIVYPLLFLALGAALRDKLFDTTVSRSIVCQELIVVDEGKYPNERTPVVRIGALEPSRGGNPPTGQIVVSGRVDADGVFVQGMPVGASRRAVIPGISLEDLYRAWQQAAQQQQRKGAPPGVRRLVPEGSDGPPLNSNPADTDIDADSAPAAAPDSSSSNSNEATTNEAPAPEQAETAPTNETQAEAAPDE